MKLSCWCGLFVVAMLGLGAAADRSEANDNLNRRVARSYSWHHDYYDPQWNGLPHAMVMPPTVRRHVEYNWGVAGTENLPIRHQYYRGWRGDVSGGGFFQPAPVQPSSTHQMGTYYIRAPW